VTQTSWKENLGMRCVDELLAMQILNGLPAPAPIVCCVVFVLTRSRNGNKNSPFGHDLQGAPLLNS